MAGNPHWLTTKRAGKCDRCGAPIARGARAFWYTVGRFLLCSAEPCGGAASREWESMRDDEKTAY